MGAAAPAARAGTGMISGTVVAADTGRPVRRVRVTLTAAEYSSGLMAISDDQGLFSFGGLPAGRYTLSASKAGYLTVKYGEKTPGLGRAGTPISLAEGQRIDRLTLPLPRTGVITGVVLDEAGDPAFGTTVRALHYVVQAGLRTLLLAAQSTADDRGVYRITALTPGDYIVSTVPPPRLQRMVVPADMIQLLPGSGQGRDDPEPLQTVATTSPLEAGRATDYVPVYFPGTTSFAAASTITLGVSEERSNVDVQLQLVPTARVSGLVLDVDGAVPRAEVDLEAAGAVGAVTSAGLPALNAMLGPDGRFSFDGVVPGQYTLTVYARRPNDPRWAMQPVTVNGANVEDLTLTLQPGIVISGVLAFEGPAPATSKHMSVMFVPEGKSHGLTPEGLPFAPVNEAIRFTASLVPGRYRVEPEPMPAGWTLVSAMFGGRDVLDFPLDVTPGEAPPLGVLTLSQRQTGLSGTLFDETGAPSAAVTVIVFAADACYWTPDSRRIQAVRPSASGRFNFTNLPPGRYRLAAASDVERDQWLDPAFLGELAGSATPVTIGAGERVVQDVRIK